MTSGLITFFCTKTVGVSGTLPVGCISVSFRLRRNIIQAKISSFLHLKLTIISTHSARHIFFKFLTRVMIFVLTTKSKMISEMLHILVFNSITYMQLFRLAVSVSPSSAPSLPPSHSPATTDSASLEPLSESSSSSPLLTWSSE